MSTRTHILLTSVVALALSLVACKHKAPNTVYMPDMVYSPALKAQQEGSMRMPVKGTVPRDFEPYAYKNENAETAGRELKNPLLATQNVLVRGQAIYNTYCLVCHGAHGEGDGQVTTRGFSRPPSLQSDKIRGWADGSIYHVMTMGQSIMPSYASQVAPGDRWAAIHYIRALQRAKHPSADDLKAAEQQ